MKISKQGLLRIIRDEYQGYLREACVKTGVDKKVVHRGQGDQKRSYIQITTVSLCDDDIQTPTEKAAKKSALKKKQKAAIKKQAQRGKEWAEDKDRQKAALARPDKVS
jgi:hypothetical protein